VGLHLLGQAVEEVLQEAGVQVVEGVGGQGRVGGEGVFHQVLDYGFGFPVGEVVESAEEEEGEVEGVGPPPGRGGGSG